MAYDAPCGGSGRYARPAVRSGTMYVSLRGWYRLHKKFTAVTPPADDVRTLADRSRSILLTTTR
eukprot:3875408-Prymnesium_polylepis.1